MNEWDTNYDHYDGEENIFRHGTKTLVRAMASLRGPISISISEVAAEEGGNSFHCPFKHRVVYNILPRYQDIHTIETTIHAHAT